MATRIVYFLADDIPNSTEQAELKELNKSLQVTVMNASENAEFGENDRILPCDFVAGTIPPEYAHIPIYDISGTSGGPIYIDDVVGLPAALDAKADKPVGIENVTGLQTELDDINTELDAAATLPIAIADVTGLQSALNSKATKPVPISDVSGLQTELDTKAELPIAISDVTGLQAELDAVALLPINISDVTGLQTELDSKATLTQLETVVDALDAKADAPIQIQDVEGLETELDSVATLPIEISDVTGLQAALDSAGSLPIEISDVTGLQAALDAPVPISDVTGLQTALDSKAALTDLDPIIADLATKQDAPVAISDVTGLQAELDSVATLPIEISDVTGLQAELDSVASLPIAISDVTGLQAELDAPTLISEVTGLQTALDGKADVTDLDPIIADLATKADAPVLITDVTGLQTELDGKAELPIAISDVTGLQAELDSSATLPITIADVTGLQTELDGKAELPVTIADVTGLQASLDSKAEVTDLTAIIAELDNKLESPIAIADVTGLQANLDSLQTEIDAAATLPIAISDVTGLQAELDAPIAITDVTGLEAALAEPVGISDVTGLQTELDSKADLADLDPIITDLNTKLSSPIAISDVTNLQTSLDGKAPVTHAHGIGEVTGLQAELDSKQVTPVPVSDVTGLQASLDSKAAAVHGHAIADVSGLQTTLDGKSETTHVHPVATTSADGFFSKTDKDKLDNIASNATAITFPAANAAGSLANGAPQPANAGAATSEGARSDHQHPLAGAANAGLMSAANWTKLDGLGGGGSGIDTTTRTYYVDSAAGSNSDDGLTPSYPKEDFAGVWAMLPATLGAPFIVYVMGSCSYIPPPTTTKAVGPDGYIVIIGYNETIVLSGTVTVTSSTYTIMDVATPGLSDDALTGLTLLIKTGTAAKCRRTITYNSANQIRFSHGLIESSSGVYQYPSATACPTFDIVKPASEIYLPENGVVMEDIPMHFTNIGINSAVPGSYNVLRRIGSTDFITSLMLGVELRCNISYVDGLDIIAGTLDHTMNVLADSTSQIGRILISMGYVSSRRGEFVAWGVGSNAAIVLNYYTIFRSGSYVGAFASKNSYVRLDAQVKFIAYGFRAKFIMIYSAFAQITGGYIIMAASGNSAIVCYGNSFLSFAGFVKHYDNTMGNAPLIQLKESAIAHIDSVRAADSWYTSIGTLTGCIIELSGNASLTIGRLLDVIMTGTYSQGCAGFKLLDNSRMEIGYLSISQMRSSIISDNARVSVFKYLNLNSLTTNNLPALTISDNGQLNVVANNPCTLVCSSSSTTATVIVQGSGASLNHRGTVATITNTYNTGTPVGLQCTAGGNAYFAINPTITASQATSIGYGVNVRGGGKFLCAVQPASVVGNAADFTLTATDNAADTDFSVALSFKVFGTSCVQRTT